MVEIGDDLEARIKGLTFDNGHGRQLAIAEIAALHPGLARLMPEIGNRIWKLYYAAKAENWTLARFQLKEAKKLLELCAVTRPKYEENLGKYIEKRVKPMMAALEAEDFARFDQELQRAIKQANAYHQLYDKPFIRWKLPDSPPPDLDLTPLGLK